MDLKVNFFIKSFAEKYLFYNCRCLNCWISKIKVNIFSVMEVILFVSIFYFGRFFFKYVLGCNWISNKKGKLILNLYINKD